MPTISTYAAQGIQKLTYPESVDCNVGGPSIASALEELRLLRDVYKSLARGESAR